MRERDHINLEDRDLEISMLNGTRCQRKDEHLKERRFIILIIEKRKELTSKLSNLRKTSFERMRNLEEKVVLIRHVLVSIKILPHQEFLSVVGHENMYFSY